MTKNQASSLKRAIQSLVKAAIADSWKGAGDPADIPLLEAELACANLRVQSLLVSYTSHSTAQSLRGTE